MSMPPPSEPHALFPIFLDLAGERALIVGEGDAAAAKLRLLQRSGAMLRIVTTKNDGPFAALARAIDAELRLRPFSPSDLDDVRLCYVALDDAEEAAKIAAAARERRILVNCADLPLHSDFATPAIVERGLITVAISTGGAAPALARDLRARIEIAIPPAYGALAAFCGSWRRRVASLLSCRRERRRFWDAVLDGPETTAVLQGDSDAADALLRSRLNGATTMPRGEVSWIDVTSPDPDLLTLKALRVLQRADLVLYGHGVAPAIRDLARREARQIALDEAPGRDHMNVMAIHLLATRHTRHGAHVVCLVPSAAAIASRRVAAVGVA